MRCIRVFVVASSVLLAGCGDGYSPLYIRACIPDQVTTDGLLSLKSGMSYEDVEKIIGPPVCWQAEDAERGYDRGRNLQLELEKLAPTSNNR